MIEEEMIFEEVALRKESVDRNLWWGVRKAVGSLVALRKESVDRNMLSLSFLAAVGSSLSARRAWIEIRNGGILRSWAWSLSARRAWIEIVDPDSDTLTDDGRSPQGERG